jgi:hypothetical protein
MVSAVLLPFLGAGTAEFVVDLLALLMGLSFIAAIAVMVRITGRE